MSRIELQYTSIFLLVMVTISGAVDRACYKPPTSNYSAIIDCCKGSAITFSEETMTPCTDLAHNKTNKNVPTELVLMNICEIHCYLNNSGVIEDGGTIQKENLIEFLKEYLPNDEMKALLRSSTDKCLREVGGWETNKKYEHGCYPHYSALIDCIQNEIITKCPETAVDSSELCSACRRCVEDCGVSPLRQLYHNITEPSSDYEYLDYHDYSSSSSESEHSESESDYSGSGYEYDSDYYGSGYEYSESEFNYSGSGYEFSFSYSYQITNTNLSSGTTETSYAELPTLN